MISVLLSFCRTLSICHTAVQDRSAEEDCIFKLSSEMRHFHTGAARRSMVNGDDSKTQDSGSTSGEQADGQGLKSDVFALDPNPLWKFIMIRNKQRNEFDLHPQAED